MEKLWANLHGGSTHFPIALMIASFLFDALAYLLREPYKRDLHIAGFYTLLLGALATFVGVLSGLVISAWIFFGQGTLAKHHDFVWPAFGLMVGLAVWRLIVRGDASRPAFGVYLIVAAVTAGLMAAAGYFGGELLEARKEAMARELKGLVAGLAAGLGVVAISYGVSAIALRTVPAETKQKEAKQAVPSEPPLPADGQTADSQLVATGRTLYRDACAGCHGQEGQGQVGPTLHRLGNSDTKIARSIIVGFPPRMPAFKDQYNDAQIKALVAYIQSLK